MSQVSVLVVVPVGVGCFLTRNRPEKCHRWRSRRQSGASVQHHRKESLLEPELGDGRVPAGHSDTESIVRGQPVQLGNVKFWESRQVGLKISGHMAGCLFGLVGVGVGRGKRRGVQRRGQDGVESVDRKKRGRGCSCALVQLETCQVKVDGRAGSDSAQGNSEGGLHQFLLASVQPQEAGSVGFLGHWGGQEPGLEGRGVGNRVVASESLLQKGRFGQRALFSRKGSLEAKELPEEFASSKLNRGQRWEGQHNSVARLQVIERHSAACGETQVLVAKHALEALVENDHQPADRDPVQRCRFQSARRRLGKRKENVRSQQVSLGSRGTLGPLGRLTFVVVVVVVVVVVAAVQGEHPGQGLTCKGRSVAHHLDVGHV